MSLTTNLHQPLNREWGVALILVLWMLVLLSTIAYSLTYSSRTEVLAAGNLVSQSQAEAYADAAVYRAIYQLSRSSPISAMPTDPSVWKADGLIRPWRYQDADLLVMIISESGKIDINAAPPPLLLGLFTSAGIEQGAAEALVDAMLDWRDGDDLRHPHGAEMAEYQEAGLHYGPANADFISIDELQQVLGMDNLLFRRIEPFITVHSYQAGIDSTIAPREVLLALPNSSPEQVDFYISQRQTLLEQGLPVPAFGPAQTFTASSGNSTYSILVEVVLSDNARFVRQAVVRMDASSSSPVSFLAWRAPFVARTVPVAPGS